MGSSTEAATENCGVEGKNLRAKGLSSDRSVMVLLPAVN
jgi:hypothetical protein